MRIEAEPGETVYSLASRAIEYAQKNNCDCAMTHNCMTVSVYPQSYIHDILEKFNYLSHYIHAKNRK